MKYKYCPLCGKKLEIKYSWDEGGVPYCDVHNQLFFDVPKPCIMVAIVKGEQILLLKQSYIFKNSKVLLAGYVGVDECAEDTVMREIQEESGLTVKNIKYLGSDYVEGKELLMLTFIAMYESGEIKKSDEVEWLDWINIEDALCQMTEDKVGTKVVQKVLEELGYGYKVAFRCKGEDYEV